MPRLAGDMHLRPMTAKGSGSKATADPIDHLVSYEMSFCQIRISFSDMINLSGKSDVVNVVSQVSCGNIVKSIA